MAPASTAQGEPATVPCPQCGGTGRVTGPTPRAPSRTEPYYCTHCGCELHYYSSRCPGCRGVNTVQAR